MEINDLLT
jgi:hypothetical protein